MTNPRFRRRLGVLLTAVACVLAVGGCAEIPLNNDPPERPQLTSTGVLGSFGVPINVTARDPDGDRMTIEFIAETGAQRQEFAWSSFVDDGSTTEFFLGLSVGQWTISARARDELEDTSEFTQIDLTVTLP